MGSIANVASSAITIKSGPSTSATKWAFAAEYGRGPNGSMEFRNHPRAFTDLISAENISAERFTNPFAARTVAI